MESHTKTALIAGGIITGIVGIAVATSNSSANKVETTTKNYNTPSYSAPSYSAPKTESKPAKVWYCVDATSYDKNPYNDNRCTNNETGEVRYVSDSQARALDSDYVPGTSGHPYYNSK